MRNSPRFLVSLVILAATSLIASAVVLLLQLQLLENHWLTWCFTTLMHVKLSLWHGGGMLVALLLIFSLVRAGLFFALSLVRTIRHAKQLGKLSTAKVPTKLVRAATKAQLNSSSISFINTNKVELYCFGWLNPKIVVTKGLLQKLSLSELIATLRHEEHHRQRRHALKLLLIATAAEAIWFLPIGREVLRYVRYRTEVASDDFAAQDCGHDAVRRALRTLLKYPVAKWQTAFAGSPAEARVETLLNHQLIKFRPSNRSIWQSLSVLGIFGAIYLALLSPSPVLAATLDQAMTEHHSHCPLPRLFTPIDNN